MIAFPAKTERDQGKQGWVSLAVAGMVPHVEKSAFHGRNSALGRQFDRVGFSARLLIRYGGWVRINALLNDLGEPCSGQRQPLKKFA